MVVVLLTPGIGEHNCCTDSRLHIVRHSLSTDELQMYTIYGTNDEWKYKLVKTNNDCGWMYMGKCAGILTYKLIGCKLYNCNNIQGLGLTIIVFFCAF